MSLRKSFESVALAVASGLAGLLIAEGGLRLYSAVSDTPVAQRLGADPYRVLIEPHGEVGYRPRPGSTFRYENSTSATVNSMGVRGPEVTWAKPAGTTRIVLLGGSTTFGWGVDDHETIERYMLEELGRLYPDRSFEVVNLAMDGYDSWQILERLRSDGVRLRPDFVIVNTGVNDVRNARFPDLVDRDPRTLLWQSEITRLREEAKKGGRSPWTRTKHWFFVARLPGILRQRAQVQPDTLTVPYGDALDYFERNLERIVAVTSAMESILLLSSDPSSLRTKYQPHDTSTRNYWIHDAETTQMYRDSLSGRLIRVVETARADDLEVHHVPPVDIPPEDFLDDTHLSPAGNRRLASHFVEALKPWLELADGPSTASAH